jgi:hypothetical protein
VGQHAKPHREEVFKDSSLIRQRLWNRLRTRCPALAFQEIVRVGLQWRNTRFPHVRETKVEGYPTSSSRCSNLRTFGFVRLGRCVLEVPRLTLTIIRVIETLWWGHVLWILLLLWRHICLIIRGHWLSLWKHSGCAMCLIQTIRCQKQAQWMQQITRAQECKG